MCSGQGLRGVMNKNTIMFNNRVYSDPSESWRALPEVRY